MRKSYQQYPDNNFSNDFSYNQEGFITTDINSTYQYQQPQIYDPSLYNPYMDVNQPYTGGNQTHFVDNQAHFGDTQQQMGGGIPNMGGNLSSSGFTLPNDFIANAALQYGSNVMEQGSDMLQRNIEKYVPTSTLKYYFAVDNLYVAKKLGLLIFPFMHKNWSMQYNHDKQPVPPRYDINAPDLYIPMMALLTYILNCGFMYGIHGQFSPEQLGIMASNAIGWLIAEILVLMLILYVVNAKTSLRYMDMIAFSGYKFVGMNFVLLLSVLFKSHGYYASLAYFSLALGYFLVRTLKIQIMPPDAMTVSDGNKRRIYLLMITALIQPAVMWLLTSSVVA